MTLAQELQAVCDSYVAAYREGDAAGCAAVFTDDAILYSAYAPPAVGQAAIAALHEVWSKDGQNKTLTIVDAGGSGDTAWMRAVFAEGDHTGEGHSLSVCTRDPSGPWRIKACSLTAG